jgi:hypothetical protein
MEIFLLKSAYDNFEMTTDMRISRGKKITSESVKYLPVIGILLKLFYEQANQPTNNYTNTITN